MSSYMCEHCGYGHVGTCPKIKAIEYHQNGTVKRIEFHEPQPLVSGATMTPANVYGPAGWWGKPQ